MHARQGGARIPYGGSSPKQQLDARGFCFRRRARGQVVGEIELDYESLINQVADPEEVTLTATSLIRVS